jgi:hypothetical protein
MRSVVGTVVAAGFAFTVLAAAGPGSVGDVQAPIQGRERVIAGHSTVRGHVVMTTGEGVGDVVVRVVERETLATKSVLTDDEGGYEIDALPAGRYLLTATKVGFVSGAYGRTVPDGASKTLMLNLNENVSNIDVRLFRAGVISGLIVDQLGNPVPGVQLMVLRPQFDRGARRLAPVRSVATTSDTGEFRLFGLSPGPYVLLATPQKQLGPGAFIRQRGLAPTFFPGTTEAGEAQAITVKAEEVVYEKLRLATVPFGSIEGSSPDSGQTGVLQLQVVRDGMPAGIAVPLVKGRFVVPNLTPGHYRLQSTPVLDPATNLRMMFAGMATIERDGGAVRGVELSKISMSKARGRFVIPPGFTPVMRGAIRLAATPVTNEDFRSGPLPSASPKDDWSFELQSWPGVARIAVQIGLPGWVLKAVRFRGVDVTDIGVQFTSGSDLEGIEIELTDRLQLVSGNVVDSQANATVDYVVAIFPENKQLWSVSRYMTLGRPDQTGRFSAKSLPIGRYYAIAVPSTTVVDLGDFDTLTRLARYATGFVLKEGDQKEVNLKITGGF